MIQNALIQFLALQLATATPATACARYGEVPLAAAAGAELIWDSAQGIATLGPLPDVGGLVEQLGLLRPSLIWQATSSGRFVQIEPARRAALVWLVGKPPRRRLALCVLRRLATESPLYREAMLPLPAGFARLPDGPVAVFAPGVEDAVLASALRLGQERLALKRAQVLLQQGGTQPGSAAARHVVAWHQALTMASPLTPLREALQQAPASPLATRSSYLLARAELERGHVSIVRQLIEPELIRAPVEYLPLMQALLAQIPGSATIELESLATRQDAAGAYAQAWLGVARWRQGSFTEGATLLQRAEIRVPSLGASAELALLIAEAHRLSGDEDGALRRFSRIVREQGPLCAIALGRVVDLKAQRGEIADARSALENCPDASQAHAAWLRVREAELHDAASQHDLTRVYSPALSEARLASLHPEIELRLAIGLHQVRDEHRALEVARQNTSISATLRALLTRAAIQRAAHDKNWLRVLRLHAHASASDLEPDQHRQAAQACSELGLWRHEIEIRKKLLQQLGMQAPVDDVLALAQAYRRNGDEAQSDTTLRFLVRLRALPDSAQFDDAEDRGSIEVCPQHARYEKARCLAGKGHLDVAMGMLGNGPSGAAMQRALQARLLAAPGDTSIDAGAGLRTLAPGVRGEHKP